MSLAPRRRPAPRSGRLALLGLLALGVLPHAALAQARGGTTDSVRIRASLEPSRVSVGETLTLEVVVEVDGGESVELDMPRPPAGFTVLGTSESSGLEVRFPGGLFRRVRRTVRLQALRPGEYRFNAPVVIDDAGRRTVGEPLYVSVDTLAGGSGPSAPTGDEDVLLLARLDADTVYVGEPVLLTGEAYLSASARRQLRRAPQYIAPSPPSFWIHDVDDSPRTRVELLGRRRYEVQSFRRAFVPITAGAFALEPAQLEVELRRGLLDPFQPRTLRTDSFRVRVLPLPPGAPTGFGGAVGRYSATATIAPAEVAQGDGVTLQVVVEGSGYVKALPPPVLPEMAGVEVLPPSERAEVREEGSGLGGRKVFTWVLIPERPGVLRVPSLAYPHFDPETEAYATARTAPLEVRVRPGAVAAAAAGSALSPLRGEASGRALGWVESPLFGAAQLLPGLALLLGVWVRRRRARGGPARVSRRALRRRRSAVLRELEALNDAADAHARLAPLVRGWVAWRLADPRLAAAAPASVARAVREGGGPSDAGESLAGVLGEAEAARFAAAPLQASARAALLRRAADAVRAVDAGAPAPTAAISEEDGARPRRAPAWSPWLLAAPALGMVCLAALAAAAQPRPGTDAPGAVREGVARYQAGEHGAAAAAFARAVRARPDDAAAWHDLGNALHAAGEPGGARWSWLQALVHDPRARDARANLLDTGTEVRLLEAASPAIPLRRAEGLLLAALFWLLGSTLVAGALVRVGPRGLTPGVVLLVLAGALAAQALLPPPGEGAAVLLDGGALRAEPVRAGATLERLEEGAGVRLLERREGWWRVVALDDPTLEGWLPEARLGVLGPHARPAPPDPLAASGWRP